MPSNAQHLAGTGEWYSREKEVSLGRRVLGSIYLDPCSSPSANTVVGASHFFTSKDRSLDRVWLSCPGLTLWVNPPGSCEKDILGYQVCGNKGKCSCKLPQRFLNKTIQECSDNEGEAVLLAYSVNILRHLSKVKMPDNLKCCIAVPPDRIPYLNPATMLQVRGTNCDSVFFHFTTKSNRLFKQVFSEAGHSVYERF